ncbi:ninjurin-2 isoform X1 [Spea bombifrons]|uniref:ninjurin-2 isoform X1 n=1 Tax=Spea bombifrons TaxID=233779 RepID=UPI00234AC764|nr:ninjurin-2 isoform X1 [Spea bombifrons]
MCERFHMRTMRILCAAPLAPCSVDGVPLGLDEWYMCVSSCTPTQKTAPRQDPDTRPAQQPGMGTQGERISMEAIGNPGPARRSAININHYATKKSLAESMLDVALFMANATQLKAVLEQGPSFTYYITLITLISLSLALQVVIGILLIIIARRNLNDIEKQPRLDLLNNVATGLVFLTVLLNIFITAFGVQKTGLYPSRGPREVN